MAADIDLALDPYNGAIPLSATNNDNYTNSGSSTAVITLSGTSGTGYSLGGSIIGDIKVVANLPVPADGNTIPNSGRLTLSNTSNTITGGIEMNNGIIYITSPAPLGTGTITLNQGVIMPSNGMTITNNIVLANGSWGGIRPSASVTFTGNISGGGDFLSMFDGSSTNIKTVTLDSPAGTEVQSKYTYAGSTSIGVYRESASANTASQLKMGKSYLLPQTTVVEVGKSLNSNYKFEVASTADAVFNVNGTTQNIAGLYGKGTVNGGGTLNINVPTGKSYAFSGTIASTTINLGGDGTLVLEGTLANTANNITVNKGTLELAKTAAADSMNDLIINSGGKLVIANNGTAQRIANRLRLANGVTVDLNGGDLYAGALGEGSNGTRTGGITNTSDEKSILTVGRADTTANYFHQAPISGNIDVVKTSTSRQRFTSTLDYTGDTYIQDGIFNLHNANIWKNTTGKIIFTGGTLMLNYDNTFENELVLLSGAANIRTGSGSRMTLNGVISGDGTLYINSGESGGGHVHLNADNTYTGNTEMRGSGTATVYANNDSAFGDGDILIDNSGATGMTIQFVTDNEIRTIRNDLRFTNGPDRKIKLTKSSNDNAALFSGTLSGNGTLDSVGINYLIDLDDWATDKKIWSGLSGEASFSSDTVFTFTADDFEDYVGQTFTIFDDVALGPATVLSGDNFDLLLPSGMTVDWAATDMGGHWGISINGVVSTPEPATWLMLLMGIVGFLAVRRRAAK